MAHWRLGYEVAKQSKSDKKFSCKVVRTKGVMKVNLGGGIPEGAEDKIEEVFTLIESTLSGLDGTDASTAEAHAALLKKIATYCNTLADQITK